MLAVRQVQSAGFWVSNDAQMAQTVVLGTSSGFPITLTWADWETDDEYKVIYDLLTPANKLQRSYSVNGPPPTVTIVAEFIDTANTKATAGGDFSLPDVGDAFTITDATGGDFGTITVTAGSVTATPTGTATVGPPPGTDPVTIDQFSGAVAWSTPNPGDVIIVTVDTGSPTGSWTSTTLTATAAITAGGDGNTTVATGGVLIFTVTAAEGEASETRVYEITPRPNT